MAANNHNPVQIVEANEGKALSVVGDSYRIVKSGADTGGDFAVIEMLVPPGGGPGPHAHADMHESFFVMEGEIEFTSEDGSYTASQGSFVTIPKGGLIHSFKNNSKEVARLWCTVVPAGLDSFFEAIGQPSTFGEYIPPPPMDEAAMKKMKKIAEEYGQVIYPPDYFEK